jgi:hypothetical protein
MAEKARFEQRMPKTTAKVFAWCKRRTDDGRPGKQPSVYLRKDRSMDRPDAQLTPIQRARLAEKGRLLYRKSCGASGKKTCAEGFAVHHINRGEIEVARDLLAFLESEVVNLRAADPGGRLALTDAMAARIREYLDESRNLRVGS